MEDKLYSWTRGEPIWEWGSLRLYGIMIFLGILFSFLSVLYFWRRQKYSLEALQVLLIIIVPTSLLGARLWFLTANWGENKGWGSITHFWSFGPGGFFHFEGMAIHGGVTISTICALIYLWTKRNMINMSTAFGIILPSVLIGQVIGRWGNFTNHEVYGGVVDGESLNWLTFIKPHMYIDNKFRAPFFFYESMANLFGYIIIVWVVLRKNWVKPGTTGSMYLIFYGIVRLIMEPLRDSEDIMKAGGIETSVLVSIIWLVLGVVTLVYFELLTMSPKWIRAFMPKFLLSSVEFEKIKPVKERRLFWFGPKSDKKKKFLFFGEEVPNKIPIWIIKKNDIKVSKRKINIDATKK